MTVLCPRANPRRARGRRGGMLIEALAALGVLAGGTAAIVGLIGHITTANSQLGFHTRALEVFQIVSAEVGSATCSIFPGQPGPSAASADPGLLVPANVWQDAATTGSSIQKIGWFWNEHPQVRVEYRVNPDVPAGPNAPAGFNVEVRIRDISGRDTARNNDAVTDTAYWVKTFPIAKVCTFRSEPANRGGYP